jgi:hypothetical protein
MLSAKAVFISAKDVAKQLGISLSMAYSLPIPRYRFGRAVRFDPADLERYKACQYVGTPGIKGGGLSSTVTMKAAGTGLANYFRRAGVEPKLTRMTEKKARDFPLSLVALPNPNP